MLEDNELSTYAGAESQAGEITLNPLEKPWWKYENNWKDEDLLLALNNRKDAFEKTSMPFYEWCERYMRAYEENPVMYQEYQNFNRMGKSWNLIRICVDAHYNRIAKITPKISYLTKGAEIEWAQLAKQVDDYMLHLFNFTDIYQQARDAYRDGLAVNFGALKLMADRKRKSFKFRRVLPFGIAFLKPYYGSTDRSEIIERAVYSRADIEEMIMNSSDEDRKAKLRYFKNTYDFEGDDRVKIYEIHKRGHKRAIFTEQCIISISDWKYDWLPYLWERWDKKIQGIIGTGVAEMVAPAQNKIYGLLYRIDLNTEFFTNPYVILPQNSQFTELDNGFGRYYEAQMGQYEKPIHVTPPIMNEQVFAHLREK